MSYLDTFVLVSPDSAAEHSEIPVSAKENKPIHVIQYELLSQHPYEYTQNDLIFEIHIRHKNISPEQLEARGDEIRAELFQKPHPCLRTSTLAKKYGWGIHYNREGKIALHAMESEAYQKFAEASDGKTQLVNAMRNARTK